MLARSLRVAGALVIVAAGLGCALQNRHSLPSYMLVAVNLPLAVFVLDADPHRHLNRVYAWLCVSLSFWGIDLVFLHVAPDAETADAWLGTVRIGMLFLPAAALHFGLALTRREKNLPRKLLIAAYLVSGVLSMLSVAGLLHSGVKWEGTMYIPRADPPAHVGYAIWVLHVLLTIPASILFVFFAWLRERSARQKRQYGFYLAAAGVAFLFGAMNLLAPLGYPGFRYGYIGGVLFFAVSGYAIVRYRWLDLEFVIRRAIVYGALTAGVAAVYAGSLLAAGLFLRAETQTRSFVGTVATICVVAFAFAPARSALQNLVDRCFYRERYDDRKLLKRLSAELSAVVGVEGIARTVLGALPSGMRMEHAVLVARVPPPDGRPVAWRQAAGGASPVRRSGEGGDLLAFLQRTHMVFSRDAWEDLAPVDPEGAKRVLDWLDREQLSVAFPLLAENRVLGAMCVGPKRSGLPYREEEIQTLSTLCSQIAARLETSRLYEEIVAMRDYSENILRSMTDGLLSVSAEGIIVRANEAAAAQLGMPMDRLTGRPVEEALGSFPGMLRMIREAEQKETPLQGEVGEDGESRRIFAVRATRLFGTDGRRGGTLLLFEDISGRKRMERELERERRLAALGEVVAQIAHEVRNPIASIKAIVEALPRRGSDPSYREAVGRIVPAEVERLNRLLEDLLDYSRPSRLGSKVVLRPASVLDGALGSLQKEVERRAIRVVRKIDEPPAWIEADGERLKQVLVNLMMNAIESMEDRERRELRIGVEAGNGRVRISVGDTGCGMSEEVRDRLFTPFFTTKHGGTGLGLAIAHRIIKDHGWDVEVQSREGEGTTFVLHCPAVPGPAQRPA